MANKPVTRCSPPTIREMRRKTNERPPPVSGRHRPHPEKQYWRGCEDAGALWAVGGNVNLASPLGNSVEAP